MRGSRSDLTDKSKFVCEIESHDAGYLGARRSAAVAPPRATLGLVGARPSRSPRATQRGLKGGRQARHVCDSRFFQAEAFHTLLTVGSFGRVSIMLRAKQSEIIRRTRPTPRVRNRIVIELNIIIRVASSTIRAHERAPALVSFVDLFFCTHGNVPGRSVGL